jgi:protein involved in polysaccharide export with SLBB domain
MATPAFAAKGINLVDSLTQPNAKASPAAPNTPAAPQAAPEATQPAWQRKQLAQPDPSAMPNLPIFGQQLFTGNFSQATAAAANDSYIITIGDKIDLKLWGGYTFEGVLTVDSQGTIFIPEAGPVKVQGIKNGDLMPLLMQHLRRTFRNSVNLHASLQTAQPVQVFVTGHVNNPGLYNGLASTSVLYFIDQAGGINLANGSFFNVALKRNGKTLQTFNLYDFLLNGELPPHQLRTGDTLVVAPRQASIHVTGDVRNAATFEFAGSALTPQALVKLAMPNPSVSHVRVQRSNQPETQAAYLTLDAFALQVLQPGDTLTFFTDKNPQALTLRVQGEHFGDDTLILPYNATLADALALLKPTEKSDMAAVQVFRRSVAQRQKEMINDLLDNLKKRMVTRGSYSAEMATVRQQDYQLFDKFIAEIASVDPKGLITFGDAPNFANFKLHEGDILYVPPVENVVKVQGEVNFPAAVAYKAGENLRYYITQSAGFTQSADKRRLYVIHNNGVLEKVSTRYVPQHDDELIVSTKLSGYGFMFTKDLAEIFFRAATAARIFAL